MAIITKSRKKDPSRLLHPVIPITAIVAIVLCVTTTLLSLDDGTAADYYNDVKSVMSLTSMPSINTTKSGVGAITAERNGKTRNWIWEEIEPHEREVAYADAMPYLKAFVDVLRKTKQDQWVSQNKCDIELFGSKWGTHQLCKKTADTTTLPDCHFISFGISVDYSFDTDLAERWQCHGFAADPTIVHKSQLHDLVTFHNIAAKTLRPNEEARTAKRPWWVASVPAVKRFLGLQHIHVLKMDCEGCEYSLARDILVEEPDFFHHVDQFTFEVHLNKHWLNDTESLYYMALLHKLLHEAGLEVMGTSIGGCGWEVEKYESMQELKDMGYPNAASKRLLGRRSCHEYLFARLEKA